MLKRTREGCGLSFDNLLVHLDHSPACAGRLDVAIGLAMRGGSRLTGLYAVSDPHVPSAASRNRKAFAARGAGEIEAMFKDRTRDAGLDAYFEKLIATNDARVNLDMVRAARAYDLVVIGQFDPATSDGSIRGDLVQQVVLRSGRPVLVIPHAGRFDSVGRRAVIAWNASREAVRAVNDAVPLLAAAESVTVLTLDPAGQPRKDVNGPLTDIVDHLAAHGIEARYERLAFDRKTIEPADRLLSHLADEAADLLVMGAFGDMDDRTQARFGLTVPILNRMTVPVLLSC